MAVSYKRLWKLLIDRDMKKKDLAEQANLSNYTINKMHRGENVTTDSEIWGRVSTKISRQTADNHNHRPCRWFAQAPLGPITSRTYRFIESSFYCMMRPTAIEIAAWHILLFVSPWLSVFLNHTLSPAFQTCSSLRSDIFSGHS